VSSSRAPSLACCPFFASIVGSLRQVNQSYHHTDAQGHQQGEQSVTRQEGCVRKSGEG